MILYQINCLSAALCFINKEFVRFQRSTCYFQINLIVIHHEHPVIRDNKCAVDIGYHVMLAPGLLLNASNIRHFLRKANRKGRPLSGLTGNLHRAIHQVYETFCDRDSKTDALQIALLCVVHTLELVKQPLCLFLCVTISRILKLKDHKCLLLIQPLMCHSELHIAPFCPLHSKIQKIIDHLANTHLITDQFTGKLWRNITLQLKPSGRSSKLCQMQGLLQQLLCAVFFLFERHLTRLQLGETQNITDDRQKICRRIFDITRKIIYLSSPAFLNNQLCQTNNRIHRCTNLM